MARRRRLSLGNLAWCNGLGLVYMLVVLSSSASIHPFIHPSPSIHPCMPFYHPRLLLPVLIWWCSYPWYGNFVKEGFIICCPPTDKARLPPTEPKFHSARQHLWYDTAVHMSLSNCPITYSPTRRSMAIQALSFCIPPNTLLKSNCLPTGLRVPDNESYLSCHVPGLSFTIMQWN